MRAPDIDFAEPSDKEVNYPILSGDSDLKDAALKEFKDSTQKQHNDIIKIMTETPLALTSNGEEIINANYDNIWYRDNVFMLFMLGCIFDEEDEELLKASLDCFNNDHRTGFLDNKVLIKNYTEPIVQHLEELVALSNGNYHVCLLPIVYKDANIDDAPEGLYMRQGIVEKYVSWNEITEYLTKSLSLYGLQTKIDKDKREKKSFEFELDGDIEPSTDTFEVETFQKRSRQVSLAKNEGKKYYQRTSQRKQNMGSLMTRIREEERVKEDTSRVSQYKGVELRYTERQMPEEYKKTIPEYVIYDDDEHLNEVAQDIDSKITMSNNMNICGGGFHKVAGTRATAQFNGISNNF